MPRGAGRASSAAPIPAHDSGATGREYRFEEVRQLSDITLTATNANSEEFQVEVEADAVGIVSIESASQLRR